MGNSVKDSNMTTGNNKDFGLGLASVKAIVEGHGGRVPVERELGKGSVFTVILPEAGEWEEEPK